MKHKFVVLIDGELHTYDEVYKIPGSFDNLIQFSPHVPPPPHTEDVHKEIESWNSVLQELMKREKR
jgi:hypothetical protein